MSRTSLKHPISKHIARDRSQELYIRFRYERPGIKDPYARVNYTTNSYYFWLIF
jgi:hypothetical protein